MRQDYPASVPCWVEVSSPDPRTTGDFYADLFGWVLQERTPSGAATPYLVATWRGGDIAGIGSLAPAPDTAWHSYVRVGDADAAAARVRAAGGTVRHEPYDVPQVARVAVCADPGGAVFRLWQGPGGAQRVNEPGTWNFSDLHTDDVDRARSFYGAVFGWRARTVDLGVETVTMWCVPGYGQVQDELEPGFLQRHREGGSPDGFVDAVGWAQQVSAQTPTGTTPHWAVTFAVADAVAVAQHCTRLGGSVTVEPHDAGGYSTVAVLRDPAGATFVINEYRG